MGRLLFSPSWYRVAALKPQLHRHAVFHRHDYRGRTWHVIEDRAAERHHRFAPATYFLIGLMDGTRTVDAIWRAAIEKLGDFAPNQDDVIRLLAQLHAADLIRTEMTAEADELFRRFRAIDRQTWLKRLGAPFALRVPLLDPDRILGVLAPLFRPVFTVWGFLLWAGLVLYAGLTAAQEWNALTDDIADRLLAPWNLAAIAIAYPVLKFFHECGHAMAVKVWGGRVRDVGVMFILFMPVPYVDASASSAFPSKWRRITVDAAGIMVELLLASLALLLWLDSEPGLWRSFLYNVIVIGTVSTLLFNGNPLLKFDGYYIFADWLEIPNLAQRAQAYLGYLIERYLFGMKNKVSPASARGERFWFLLYAPLAWAYRVFLTFSIALFLSAQYMVVGLLLAGWAVLLMGIVPTFRTVSKLFGGQEFAGRRPRVAAVSAGLAAAVLAVLFLLPLPRATIAQGVAVVPENGSVRANAEGFVRAVLARPDSLVPAGAPLVRLTDDTVDAEVKVATAKLRSLDAQLAALDFTNEVDAAVVRQEIKGVEAALRNQSVRQADQTITAPAAGVFRLLAPEDSEGRFVRRGETVAYVETPGRHSISVLLDQLAFGDVQTGIRSVSFWPAGHATKPLEARVVRLYPGGRTTLPSAAFAVEGGGDIPVDPQRPGEWRALANLFQVDIEPVDPEAPGPVLVGRHFLVRFEHAPEPLGAQLFTWGRRLLLTRFGV